MATPVRDIASGMAKTASGLREVIQDLVTPDLRALRSQADALAQELRLRNEALSHEMKLRSESLQEALSNEIRLRTEKLQDELRLRDSNQTTSFQRLEQSQAALTDAVRELARRIDAHNVDFAGTRRSRLSKGAQVSGCNLRK